MLKIGEIVVHFDGIRVQVARFFSTNQEILTSFGSINKKHYSFYVPNRFGMSQCVVYIDVRALTKNDSNTNLMDLKAEKKPKSL